MKPLENHGLWELAALALLRERPMHPYEMQLLLAQRHKDDLLALKRGSLYHAIRRLLAAQLIDPLRTERNGRRPERTTYRITRAGRREFIQWLRRQIAAPRRERSAFTGSLSFLVYLAPEDAAARLEERAMALEKEVAGLGAVLEEAEPRAGRINLIETEYAQAMRAAELEWVRGIVDELRSGRLAWDLDRILAAVRANALATARKEA